jgi:hypothetical protein
MSSSSELPHAFVATVFYPRSKPTAFRMVQSDVSPLVLLVAPKCDRAELLARPEIGGAAAYGLVGRGRDGKAIHQIYFGESLDPKDRIPRHFLDDTRSGWVTEILAICARGNGLGKDRLLQFQHRLTMVAEDVGHARVVRGTAPIAPRRSEIEDAIGDRLFADLRCMLIAAGCRILESDRQQGDHERLEQIEAAGPPPQPDRPARSQDSDTQIPAIKPATPRIEDGIYRIARDNLWAMAVINGAVMLRAGSEVRSEPVETCPSWVVDLREDARKRGLLVPIADEPDRLRLNEDLVMTSLSTAGKFVTGRNAPLSIWNKVGSDS